MITVILTFSIIFQLSAAFFALKLIKYTGLKHSWILISMALFLMSIRRIIPFYVNIANIKYDMNLLNEGIGLTLSFLMLLGVRGIEAIFNEKNIAEKKIQALLKEKEQILKEVHHRIKNNMTIIQNLFTLHSSTLQDKKAIDALEDAKCRVQSMLVLYDKLYESTDFLNISLKSYLSVLIDEILINFPGCDSISVEKDIDEINLDAKALQPLGIIINELITNIMKYAFKGRMNGSIKVSAKISDNGSLVVTIIDDGIGIPESINFENTTGFGLMLIGELVKQLDGEIAIERIYGTKITIRLKAGASQFRGVQVRTALPECRSPWRSLWSRVRTAG